MGLAAGLAIGQLALSAVSSATGAAMSASAANAQSRAALKNFQARDAELTRQQIETKRIASEDKSDTIREADRTLGEIRVAAGEVGAMGNTSYIRMMVELGGAEGIDLSRIERNRQEAVASAQAGKEAAAISGQNVVNRAQNEHTSNLVGSVLGFVGTGLQVGSDHVRRQEELELLRNRGGSKT